MSWAGPRPAPPGPGAVVSAGRAQLRDVSVAGGAWRAPVLVPRAPGGRRGLEHQCPGGRRAGQVRAQVWRARGRWAGCARAGPAPTQPRAVSLQPEERRNGTPSRGAGLTSALGPVQPCGGPGGGSSRGGAMGGVGSELRRGEGLTGTGSSVGPRRATL